MSKTNKICSIELIAVNILCIVYALTEREIDIGRFVLFFAISSIALSIAISALSKKESVAVYATVFLIVVSTSVNCYLADVLPLAIMLFFVNTACISLFVEGKYILFSGGVSLFALLVYLLISPGKVFEQVGSLFLYLIFLALFVCGTVNLYLLVSNSKKNIRSLEIKSEEAERANESKMLFLTNMSHDIRTPMNAICGMAELTLREKSLTPEVRSNVESIQTGGRVLISIVNDILDYSKLESGKMEIIPVSYSFRQLVNDVLNMVSVKLEDKDIEIRAEIQEELPDIYIGDEIRIRQILFNIMSNAVKYTDKGYVILKVNGTEDGGFVDFVISVTDSGIGIKKDDISKLFESFQTFDSRKARTREGTGLGLAICKHLLNFMGGDITVESTYGVGTKFTVTLTQKVSDDDIVLSMAKNDAKEDAKVSAHDAKVLVVDDSAVNLKVAKGLIRTFGITVDTCLSGKECLEILKTTKDYDIIFIDHMMPELDGIDTLNLIRADASEYMRKVPLIALTANVASGARDMFMSEGFDDYVAKPIDMIWLNGILRKFLPLEKQR